MFDFSSSMAQQYTCKNVRLQIYDNILNDTF